MAFGYEFTLEREENGWWLVRFPNVPEALTEGESRVEARGLAVDCLIAALEGYIHVGRALPRGGAGRVGLEWAILPSLVTAKLAVYQTMRAAKWSRVKLAAELGVTENAVRRLLNLRHNSQMWVIDQALARMGKHLSIDLPTVDLEGKAA
jgi:antitoxin HicB